MATFPFKGAISTGRKNKRKPLRKAPMTASAVKTIVEKTINQSLEKKSGGVTTFGEPIGQIFEQSPGYYSVELTPEPAQGVGATSRIGDTIDLVSMHIAFQIQEQKYAAQRVRFRVMIVQNLKQQSNDVFTTGNSNNPVERMYDPNSFIRNSTGASANIIDYSSNRNQEQFGNFRILASKRVSMKPDAIANTANRLITSSIGFKLKKPMPLHYSNTTGSPNNQQLFLLVLADTGNIGNTATTLTEGVGQTLAQSGTMVSFESTDYYTDA